MRLQDSGRRDHPHAGCELLTAEDPPVFQLRQPVASTPWFFTVDHAGRQLPRALGSLGLSPSDLARHIAWDIGAGALGEQLAQRLDAFVIAQTYSRLVIDCNRTPGSPQSIVTRSEQTEIPGNQQVTAEAAQTRARAIFHPYHERIGRELDARQHSGQITYVVAVHSFTPRFMGVDRRWHAGVLYNRDARLGCVLRDLLLADGDGLVVGDNEPYALGDDTDYTIPMHAERRGLPHVELEIRQDLIDTPEGQAAWATRLARLLPQAAAQLSAAS